ncbi:hybrid sensor histidine kinase/response regulator transcription factor [Flexithrix dorotheae]|uniref:hybrid sensor histidine kinase/response regulator transcription factor n=1 Tax=Flexithrix dorotheae TaxID=70993 RepID=UPI000363E347|nr:hybrid sensor histidine kinase/response regulator transcription factor [Flexithrix dorotheae]
MKVYSIFLVLTLSSFWWTPNPKPYLKFNRLSIENGLSQNNINCILQDNKGFMWFGTWEGLNKYDGHKFSVFKSDPADSTSLSDIVVTTLFEDSKGNLWVGTRDGLNLFNRYQNNFSRYNVDEGNPYSLNGNYITSIEEDGEGHIWVGTEEGLNKFDSVSQTFQRINFSQLAGQNADLDTARNIYSLLRDSHEQLWIGTDKGVFILNSKNGTLQNTLNINNGLAKTLVNTITEDSQGNIWLGTEKNGIIIYNLYEKSVLSLRYQPEEQNSLSHNSIRAIIEDSNQKVWVATDGGGLNLFDKKHHAFTRFGHEVNNPYSLQSNALKCLFEDRDGNIWVGALAWGGLCYANPSRQYFKHYRPGFPNKNSLNNGAVNGFYERENGDIWIATDGGGINLFQKKENSFEHFKHDPFDTKSLSSNKVLDLLEDFEGNLWAATWDGGLNKKEKGSEKFIRYLPGSGEQKGNISSEHIWSIFEDSEKNLWIGTFGRGLSLYDRKNDAFISFEGCQDSLPGNGNHIISIYEDRQNNLWVGTLGDGLKTFDKANGLVLDVDMVSDSSEISSIVNDVWVIYEDASNNLWLGTSSGLKKYNRKTKILNSFSIEDGLPNNVVYGILEDYSGKLWLSTNKGLSCFNPLTRQFRNFDSGDGLQSNQFIQGSYFKGKSGKMYFGGINGFTVFKPEEIKVNPKIPKVVVTDFQLFNKPVEIGGENSPLKKHISETNEITLLHCQNVFSFEFAALNFTPTQKSRYEYKMENLDENWIESGTRRFVSYTNLAPGEYVFRVKACNNDNIWNEAGTSIKITILPPPWKTWWAYLGYFLLSVTILVIARRQIIYKERLKNQFRLKDIETHKLQELSELKSKFFTQVSHEFRTPLSLILGPLRSLKSGTFKGDVNLQYNIMTRNAQKLLNLINQLLDISKLESGNMQLSIGKGNLISFIRPLVDTFENTAKLKNLNFSFHADTLSFQAYFDGDKVEKVLTNLLSNALKFTGREGSIRFEVNTKNIDWNNYVLRENWQKNDNLFVEFIIQDSGIGIPEKAIPHIFDRFYQAEKQGEYRKNEGSGIGLALTKELVELHKGKIRVKSKEGEGTTFSILLPVGKEHYSSAELVQFKHQNYCVSNFANILEDTEIGFDDDVVKNKKSSALPKLLIVDDNADMRTFLKNALKEKYQILEARNGMAGLVLARKKHPDLIITDLMMPEIDGQELCHQIKGDDKTDHIPVILLTAKTGERSKMESLKNGADDFITKPFDLVELELKIKNLLELKKRVEEKVEQEQVIYTEKVSVNSVEEKFLQKAIEIVESHKSDPNFNAEAFIKEFGMSRSQIHRKIKAITHKSVIEFIRSYRLQFAKQLIEQNYGNISEIAFEAGFNSPSYFAECFKKEFGVSPSEFMVGKS